MNLSDTLKQIADLLNARFPRLTWRVIGDSVFGKMGQDAIAKIDFDSSDASGIYFNFGVVLVVDTEITRRGVISLEHPNQGERVVNAVDSLVRYVRARGQAFMSCANAVDSE